MAERGRTTRARRRVGTVVAALVLGGLVVVTEVGPDPSAAAVHPGFTEQVSLDVDGNPVIDEEDFDDDSESTDGAISADGSAVVFASQATLDPERDLSDGWDVYLRDRDLGRTILISRAWEVGIEPGETGGWVEVVGCQTFTGCATDSVNPSISADGRFIGFESDAANLDPGPGFETTVDDGLVDVFVYDRDPDADGVFDEDFEAADYDGDGAPTLVRMPNLLVDDVGTDDYDAVVDDGGTEGLAPTSATDVSLSADGRHVAFTTIGDGPYHSPAEPSDPGEPRFIDVLVRYDVADVDWFEPTGGEEGVATYRVTLDDLDDPSPAIVELVPPTEDDDRLDDLPLVPGHWYTVEVCAVPLVDPSGVACGPTVTFFVDPEPSSTIVVDRDADGDGIYDEFTQPPTPGTPAGASAAQLERRLVGWDPTPLTEPEISSDGRWVTSVAGRTPDIGFSDIERVVVGFTSIVAIDRDPDGDGDGLDAAPVAVPVDPAAPDTIHQEPVVSGDGRVLAFARFEPLVGSDASTAQVYASDRGGADASGGFPGTPVTRLVSVADPSAPTVGGDGRSDAPDVSDLGRYVSFSSRADDLPHVPNLCGEGGTCQDVFVADLARPDEEVVLVTADRDEDGSSPPDLGSDGFYSEHSALTEAGDIVAFDSTASNVRDAPLPDDWFNRDVFAHEFRPELEGLPNPTDFGLVPLTTSQDRTVTFTNIDWGPLRLRDVDAVTNGDPHFTIIASTCDGAVLHGGDSCEVDVRFTPTVEASEDDLLVAFSDEGVPLERVRLIGRGAPAPVGPLFRADPDPVDFGPVEVAGAAALEDVTVSNDGDAPFTVDGTSLVGPAAGDVTIVDDGCTGEEITPVETCIVRLGFDPSQRGLRSAVLRFDDTAPGAPHDVAIRGVGTAPRFRAVPDPVDHGTPLIGQPVERLVTVTNIGDAPMAMISTAIAGPQAGDFEVVVDGCSGLDIAPAGACQVRVRHTASAAGARAAVLRFVDDASGSPHEVDLLSRPPTPVLLLSPGVGQPGAVVTVLGFGWPPSRPVTLTWIDAAGDDLVVSDAAGEFTAPGLLVLPRSALGTRQAQGAATTVGGVPVSATAPFLVVPATVDGTPQFVFRK